MFFNRYQPEFRGSYNAKRPLRAYEMSGEVKVFRFRNPAFGGIFAPHMRGYDVPYVISRGILGDMWPVFLNFISVLLCKLPYFPVNLAFKVSLSNLRIKSAL